MHVMIIPKIIGTPHNTSYITSGEDVCELSCCLVNCELSR